MDTRFQVCFTPLAAVLFAFPSRYSFTIGHQGVFSLGGWSPRIQTAFHVHRPNWDPRRSGRAFGHGAVTRYGSAFQRIGLTVPVPRPSPATPKSKLFGLGSCAFARHYSRNLSRFLFLWVLRCFTSPRVASTDYVFIREYHPMTGGGLPHSEISGSKPVDGSPKLIAVFRVLHRLLMPRHPSCARIRLARNILPRSDEPCGPSNLVYEL